MFHGVSFGTFSCGTVCYSEITNANKSNVIRQKGIFWSRYKNEGYSNSILLETEKVLCTQFVQGSPGWLCTHSLTATHSMTDGRTDGNAPKRREKWGGLRSVPVPFVLSLEVHWCTVRKQETTLAYNCIYIRCNDS